MEIQNDNGMVPRERGVIEQLDDLKTNHAAIKDARAAYKVQRKDTIKDLERKVWQLIVILVNAIRLRA